MALSSGAAHGISAQWGDLERSFRPMIGALVRCRTALEGVDGLTGWTGPASEATKTVVRELIAAVAGAIEGLQALVDEAVTQREYWTDMGHKIHKSAVLNIVFAVVGGLLTLTTFFIGPIGALIGRGLGFVARSVLPAVTRLGQILPGLGSQAGRAVSTVLRGRWPGAGKKTGVAMETLYSTGIDYTISFAVDASIRRITEAVTGIKANYALSAILAVGGVAGNVAFGAVKIASPRFRDFLLRNPMVEDIAAPPVIGTIATPTALGLATTIVDLDVDAGAYYLGIGGSFIAGAGNVAARRGFAATNRALDARFPHTPNIGDYFHGPVRGVVHGTTNRRDPDGRPLPPVRTGIGDLEREAKANRRALREAESEVENAERQAVAARRSAEGLALPGSGAAATGERTRGRADLEAERAAAATRRRDDHLLRSRDPDRSDAARAQDARSAASAAAVAANHRRREGQLRETAARQDRMVRDAEDNLDATRAAATAAGSRVDRDRDEQSLIDAQIEYLRRSIPFTELWFRIFGQVGSRVGSRGVAGLISDIFTPQPTTQAVPAAPGQVDVPAPEALTPADPEPLDPEPLDSELVDPEVRGADVGPDLNAMQIGLRDVGRDLNQLEQGINTALARLDTSGIDSAQTWDLKHRLESFREEVTALQGRIAVTQNHLNAGGATTRSVVSTFWAEAVVIRGDLTLLGLEVDLAGSVQAVA